MADKPGTTPSDKKDDSDEPELDVEELFSDLDDEDDMVETPASLQHEKDQLLLQLGALTHRFEEAEKKHGAQMEEQRRIHERAQRQFDEQKSFAIEKFVKDLLPVVDNLERGLSVIPADARAADPKFDKLAQGTELTLKQLKDVFNKFGVKEINPVGAEFDPNKHEAISTATRADLDEDVVVQVLQKGYELNGRVIRPARIIVNKP